MEKIKYEKPVISKITAGMPSKFGLPAKQKVISEIDGIPVSKLMEEYGSPVFVFSEKTIRNTISEARRAFETRYPKVQFAWSYKTNYLDAVCNVFHQEGSWAEVVSGFEYQKALRNGVPGNLIIFNGPDKSVEDLKKAVENRSLIHIDHFDELYSLIEMLEGTSYRLVQEEVETEMVTPSGLGILKGIKALPVSAIPGKILATGIGFGKKDTGRPQGVRAYLLDKSVK